KVADIVRHHAIQPANAVRSGQHPLALPAHVEKGAALQQRLKFSCGIAKICWGFRAAVYAETGAAGRKLLLKSGNTHTESLIIAKEGRQHSAVSTQQSAFSQQHSAFSIQFSRLSVDGGFVEILSCSAIFQPIL